MPTFVIMDGQFRQQQAALLEKFELHLTVEQPEPALDLLARHCSLTRTVLKQAIAKGALWFTADEKQKPRRLHRAKKSLAAGNMLHIYYDAKVLAQQTAPAELIADFQDYSIWYKPYGMLCQGSKWSDHCTIGRWAEQHLQPERPAFIVHRLDRAASGLIIIAHSKQSARAFSAMFEQHQLDKRYQIIVHGDHRTRPQPDVIAAEVDGKPAQSMFQCRQYRPDIDMSLLDVQIKTGRKHQIRCHAASIGLPVLGDRLHGSQAHDIALDLQLCAVSLTFVCPFSQQQRQLLLPEHLRPQLDAIVAKP